MSDVLTDDEKTTMLKAAYGAVTLVSLAYPGTFSTTKENIVGAKVLTSATGMIGRVLSSKQKVKFTGGSTAEVADEVLPALSSTLATLQAKAPNEVQEFRRTVKTAVEQAAGSTGSGSSPAQTDMIAKVTAALGEA